MTKKIILLILIIFTLWNLFTNTFATDEIVSGAQNFLQKGTNETLIEPNIKATSNNIYNAFLIVGTILVVLVGAIIGIQFMLGTAEEKAKVKETLIPYLIGTIVIFGSYAIWRAVAVAFMQLD